MSNVELVGIFIFARTSKINQINQPQRRHKTELKSHIPQNQQVEDGENNGGKYKRIYGIVGTS
jgi:hypothetical protein